jgi:GT2 family glycosyltransferase
MGTEPSDGDRVEDAGPTLSVVVVTYNESEHIGSCLESVFDCCESVEDLEVIVVDSNSTDDTVQRALAFPVTVYRITDDELCTPSAGRYVGTKLSGGDSILFVDGDMTLTTGWLPVAREFLDRNSDVAGVDGYLDSVETVRSKATGYLRGIALYDREVLETVGGFDPHLSALEDVELGYRLTTSGYRLVRLPTVVGTHPRSSGPTEWLRRWRYGYYYGWGEVFRKSLGRPRVFGKILYRARMYVGGLCWLAVGGVATLSGGLLVVGWVLVSIGLAIAFAAYRGPQAAAVKLTAFPMVYAGMVLGMLGAPPEPESFPMDTVEQVGPLPDETRRASPDRR